MKKRQGARKSVPTPKGAAKGARYARLAKADAFERWLIAQRQRLMKKCLPSLMGEYHTYEQAAWAWKKFKRSERGRKGK